MSSQNPLLILHAVLQGQPQRLPPNLDPIWQDLIQPLAQNQDPAQALPAAIKSLTTAQLNQLQFDLLLQYIRLLNVFLTPRQAEMLAFLLESGPVTLDQIATAFQKDPGNLHRRLTSLTKKGLVARSHHNHRIHYHLTIQPRP